MIVRRQRKDFAISQLKTLPFTDTMEGDEERFRKKKRKKDRGTKGAVGGRGGSVGGGGRGGRQRVLQLKFHFF